MCDFKQTHTHTHPFRILWQTVYVRGASMLWRVGFSPNATGRTLCDVKDRNIKYIIYMIVHQGCHIYALRTWMGRMWVCKRDPICFAARSSLSFAKPTGVDGEESDFCATKIRVYVLYDILRDKWRRALSKEGAVSISAHCRGRLHSIVHVMLDVNKRNGICMHILVCTKRGTAMAQWGRINVVNAPWSNQAQEYQ